MKLNNLQHEDSDLYRVRELLKQQEAWRSQTLNLIASENIISPAVRSALDNDWIGRYSDYTGRDLKDRRYRGTRYIAELEQLVETLAKRIFKAEFVELRPISGHLAGAAVITGLCKPGDVVLELGADGGGHREAKKVSMAKLMHLDVHFLPFDAARYNIEVEASQELIERTRPRLVILGSSNFLFPHPVRHIKKILTSVSPESLLIYDASHVMGFMATNRFQDPLVEGADLVFGSTHKTLPGPQGGLIYTNREDLIRPVSEAVYPALVTNHHSFRMPGLAVALLEMERFGQAYMDQVSVNSQAFGIALEGEGVQCVNVDGWYSKSHTVLARVDSFGKGSEIAQRLEQADIITTAASLPESLGSQGIRLGVQEITRMGANEADMKTVAHLLAQALSYKNDPHLIAESVHAFTTATGPIHFTW